MIYTKECGLEQFDAWSGGNDTLLVLVAKDLCDEVEMLINEVFGDNPPTETEVNDFLWFERDFIAEHLGYRNWDDLESEDEEVDEEGEEYLDSCDEPIHVGDVVEWCDEAGVDEDGTRIRFKVVDEDGEGYFNLSYGEEDEHPDRWAYHYELIVVSE